MKHKGMGFVLLDACTWLDQKGWAIESWASGSCHCSHQSKGYGPESSKYAPWDSICKLANSETNFYTESRNEENN